MVNFCFKRKAKLTQFEIRYSNSISKINVACTVISISYYIFGMAIWDKFPSVLLKLLRKLPQESENNFKIFKSQVADLSQKLLEPLTNTLY